MENPDFLTRPRTLVQFENPIFDDAEITQIFEQDVADVAAAAPEPDFTDIVRLSRPIFSREPSGVRVSRIGQRGTILTRSGLQIGARVHYYFDISDIPNATDIELQPIAETSGLSESVTPGGIEEINLEAETGFNEEEELLDDLNTTVGEHLQLITQQNAQNEVEDLTVPTPRTDFTVRRPPHFYPGADSIFVRSPQADKGRPRVIPHDTPSIIVVASSGVDYYLHPSLCRRKRRKCDYFY